MNGEKFESERFLEREFLILRLGDIMEVGFEQVLLMYNGAVSDVAEVFDTYVYRIGVQQGQFSYSTAAGLFKSVVGMRR